MTLLGREMYTDLNKVYKDFKAIMPINLIKNCLQNVI